MHAEFFVELLASIYKSTAMDQKEYFFRLGILWGIDIQDSVRAAEGEAFRLSIHRHGRGECFSIGIGNIGFDIDTFRKDCGLHPRSVTLDAVFDKCFSVHVRDAEKDSRI